MASFETQTGQSIDEAFAEFDKANPHVYQRFCEHALKLIAAGRRRYSSKTILCVLRYEHDLKTVVSEGEFRINDALTSRYARKFEAQYPEHAGFFEMRQLRSGPRKEKPLVQEALFE